MRTPEPIALDNALYRLGAALGSAVSGADLVRYAAEDHIGGYHPQPELQRFPAGSVWGVEGLVLYALVRALQPETVVEVGVYAGCSTTHILTALQRNGKGKLISYDFEYPGWLVPENLKAYWSFVKADAFEALVADPVKADLCFEDAMHDERTGELIKLMCQQCEPAVIVSHDAEHFRIGAMVRRGWDEAFGANNYDTALIAPADCGLAWKVIAA